MRGGNTPPGAALCLLIVQEARQHHIAQYEPPRGEKNKFALNASGVAT